ncbi:unnamed protein product [Adineta steineri]|uniref:Uncharacterized protein n=1 Tax=Adineta steineri TaxID=433720 RepID=A0A820A088_9BILA|nr:unnamed protein product [Adineta steineri]
MLIGAVLVIVGASVSGKSNTSLWTTIVSIGLGIFLIFLCIFIFVQSFVHTSQTRRAANAESLKYFTRLPIPTSWRLMINEHITYYWNGGRRIYTTSYIVIDIGTKNVAGVTILASKMNTNINEPTSYIP